jgi:hypothetical protein
LLAILEAFVPGLAVDLYAHLVRLDGKWSTSRQLRCLPRQLSLPVSMMSQ